jgi:two-component system NtrC family response regulator
MAATQPNELPFSESLQSVKPRLLIIDDDEDIRSQLKWALCQDYEVSLAEDRRNGLDIFRAERPPVALLDLGLPPNPGGPGEGFAALAELLAGDDLTKVIILTGQAEKENALRAVSEGAYDFLAKPPQIEELKIVLKRAFHLHALEREHRALQHQARPAAFEDMLGASAEMQTVFTAIRKVATTDAPVLILGESGTGKEMAAQAIHRRSRRKDGPFVAINCGAIPANLLESELFGHEKGTFTGAHAQRIGRIETAAGGTLFLDEIGELPLALQVKLLRFLQEQQIERVGGRKPIDVDARIITATNIDLARAVKDGTFREDCYYRIAVVVMKLPPLRGRPGDVPLLAQSFLQRFAREAKKEKLKFDARATTAIQQYAWPGNVRELENRVRRAVIMSEGAKVTAADLELADLVDAPPLRTLREAREAVEREVVQQALQRHGGKISRAAEALGISRPTLYELLEKLGMGRGAEEKE